MYSRSMIVKKRNVNNRNMIIQTHETNDVTDHNPCTRQMMDANLILCETFSRSYLNDKRCEKM